jgi:hypothetical protein
MIRHQCFQAAGDGVVQILGGLLGGLCVRVEGELSVRYLGSLTILEDKRGSRWQTPQISKKGATSATISKGNPGGHCIIVDFATREASLVDRPDIAPKNEPAVVATKKERTYAQDVGDECKPAFPWLVHYDDKGAQELLEPHILLAGDNGCAPRRNIGRSDFRMRWNSPYIGTQSVFVGDKRL